MSIMVVAALLGCVSSEERKRAEFFEPKVKQPASPPKPPFAIDEAEAEILEATVRRFVQDASGELKAPVGTVFLALSENRLDPGAEFMKRFSSANFRVRPWSAMPRASESAGDAAGKTKPVFLVVQRVNWLDFSNVQVPCSWSPDGSKQLVFSYALARKGSRWTVQ